MRTTKLFPAIIAAGLAGVAFAKFGSASILASLAGDELFAIGASLALVGFAVYDYSRRHEPLRPKSPIIRPPVTSLPPTWRVAPVPARASRESERTAA